MNHSLPLCFRHPPIEINRQERIERFAHQRGQRGRLSARRHRNRHAVTTDRAAQKRRLIFPLQHIAVGGQCSAFLFRAPIPEFAQQLYAAESVSVLPGSYLARDAGGVNPGRGYVRIALVAEFTIETS